jgi:hypothetical protein
MSWIEHEITRRREIHSAVLDYKIEASSLERQAKEYRDRIAMMELFQIGGVVINGEGQAEVDLGHKMVLVKDMDVYTLTSPYWSIDSIRVRNRDELIAAASTMLKEIGNMELNRNA